MENKKKLLAKKKKQRRRNAEERLWKQIMKRDLEMSDLTLYEQTLNSRMLQEAFILERKRDPKSYIS